MKEAIIIWLVVLGLIAGAWLVADVVCDVDGCANRIESKLGAK